MTLQQISWHVLKYTNRIFGTKKKNFTIFHCVQVKRIIYEEEGGSSESSHPGSASSEDEDIFEETAQVSQTQIFTCRTIHVVLSQNIRGEIFVFSYKQMKYLVFTVVSCSKTNKKSL